MFALAGVNGLSLSEYSVSLSACTWLFAGKHGLFVFTYPLHVWLHVGFNAAIFSSEGRTGFVSLSLGKCQRAMIRSVKCPQIRQSDEQLRIPASENVQRDNQRTLV